MPNHSSANTSTPEITMNRSDWVKFTTRPNGPSAVWSSNWLSASMPPPEPSAATLPSSPWSEPVSAQPRLGA